MQNHAKQTSLISWCVQRPVLSTALVAVMVVFGNELLSLASPKAKTITVTDQLLEEDQNTIYWNADADAAYQRVVSALTSDKFREARDAILNGLANQRHRAGSLVSTAAYSARIAANSAKRVDGYF